MNKKCFTSIRITFLWLSIAIITLFLNACITKQPNDTLETIQPFHISVDKMEVINDQQMVFLDNDLTNTDQQENRLILTVSIQNITDMDFKEVWFELELNPEVEPFISSHILKFTSDKMDVTTQKKVQSAEAKNNTMIWAFSHEWDMLLTTEEDLYSYYNLSTEKLVEDLNSITVKVHWSGGMQEITIPLEITKL